MHDQLTLGEALRDEGMALAVDAAGEWKQAWADAIEQFARERAFDGSPRRFTAEDVRARAGAPTDGHTNATGALFSAAARRGLIEAVGFCKARRPERHASRFVVWRGTPEAQGR